MLVTGGYIAGLSSIVVELNPDAPSTIAIMAFLADDHLAIGVIMTTWSAKEARYGFGRLIDLARTQPLIVAKHGRPVVVVMPFEEFDRLKAIEARKPAMGRSGGAQDNA